VRIASGSKGWDDGIAKAVPAGAPALERLRSPCDLAPLIAPELSMWYSLAMRASLAIVALLCLVACGPVPEDVDLLLTQGRVYTVDPAQPWAEAVAIRGGRIVAVGTTADLAARYRAKHQRALAGAMVLPGFHDAHVHPEGAGIELSQCDLNGLSSVDAILATVRGCVESTPGDGWIVGGGWNLSLFPQAHPRKESLDEITTERPIALTGADGHSTWANSKALALAGIDATTPNPVHGIIERDRATGEATGTLREAAQGLLREVVPEPTRAEREAGLERALGVLRQVGITSFVDASVGGKTLETYRTLLARGELTARVVASVEANVADLDALVSPGDRGSGSRLRVDAVKFFLDGVLEGETAALLEPYLGRDGAMGQLNFEPDVLGARVTALDARGVQVHMHAIGDRAVRAGLDALAAARAANGPRDNRHHIAHLQLIDPTDYPRFAELGVLANFQSLWAFPDAYIMDVNLPVVGQARVDRMYPIGSLFRAGARIVGGSDWSVDPADPLLAIETAVTRSDPRGTVAGVLNAAEAVPLDVMIAAYTINGAYLMHQENETGSITVGKAADLVVLDRDLFAIPPEEISEARVLATYLDGVAIYGD
jgi:predicted amidohydrolase YtcJ